MTLRLFVLQAHYRKPLDFTAAALEAAATGWKGLGGALAVGRSQQGLLGWSESAAGSGAALPEELAASRRRFVAAMDDDLNTAAALGELFELARPLRALANRLQRGDLPSEADRVLGGRWRLLVELAEVLGLQPDQPRPLTAPGSSSAEANLAGCTAPQALHDGAIETMVAERKAAKANRDFATADRLRDELREQGIELVDKPGGITVWLRG
jgi:cysteinyl-tRNA synthetase